MDTDQLSKGLKFLPNEAYLRNRSLVKFGLVQEKNEPFIRMFVCKVDIQIGMAVKEGITALKTFSKDARHFQIAYLLLFLVYGVAELKWEVSAAQILVVIGSCLTTQFIWLKITGGDLSRIKSAAITALGLCLLLKSVSLVTLGLAGLLAISSKFIIQVQKKHLFNPTNFGIIISIVLLGDAWISPGQWGSSAVFLFVLSILGGFILHKIGRLETSLVFLGSLFLMENDDPFTCH